MFTLDTLSRAHLKCTRLGTSWTVFSSNHLPEISY